MARAAEQPRRTARRPQSARSATSQRAAAGAAGRTMVYRVEAAELHAHLFRVTMTIPRPADEQVLSLPVWIPGSYLVREFARHLQRLQAHQAGQACATEQLDKNHWRVACNPRRDLVVSYEVYAFDQSVRAAWLDTTRGFFNGTSLLLQVHGRTSEPAVLELRPPRGRSDWRVATALAPLEVDRRGFGRYRAASYDELADSPVEIGDFWQGEFAAGGVRHRVAVSGAAGGFDGARLITDTQRICESAIRLWHGRPGRKRLDAKPPHRDYLFLLNVADEGYGGLEHRASTALLAPRKDLPRPGSPATGQPLRATDGYTNLLALVGHEYFHTWNVKRLRPREYAHYDYTRENYTQLLWFFEGFTTYYEELLLRRAGLIDDTAYLMLLTKTVNQVQQTPGRLVQSAADASFDAWVKYYRQDENTANATVSYYTKGACIALCLDLALRQHGSTTLDAVMRGLWQRCRGGPMDEDDLLAVLAERSGRAWMQEIAAWAHGTGELPLRALLEGQGVAVLEEPAQPAQALGLRVTEGSGGIVVKAVLRGGPAEAAGFAAGDEWLALEHGSGRAMQCWRLMRLDDMALYAPEGRSATALVARDRRMLRLPLVMPRAQTTWRLVVRDAQRVAGWLDG